MLRVLDAVLPVPFLYSLNSDTALLVIRSTEILVCG